MHILDLVTVHYTTFRLDVFLVHVRLERARPVNGSDRTEFRNLIRLNCLTELACTALCELEEAGCPVFAVECSFKHLGIIRLNVATVEMLVKIRSDFCKLGIRVTFFLQNSTDAVFNILHERKTEEVKLDEAVVLQVTEVHPLSPGRLQVTSHLDNRHGPSQFIGWSDNYASSMATHTAVLHEQGFDVILDLRILLHEVTILLRVLHASFVREHVNRLLLIGITI